MLPEILGVVCEGGVVWAPLTPITTFRDVAACVRDPGDPLPTLLEHSPLGARVVGQWERPLELLRLWGVLRGEISYHAHPPSTPASPSPSDDEGVGEIRPWELYELKDQLKGIARRPSLPAHHAHHHHRRLNDSDELAVVSSDEGDASFTSHHYHTPSSSPTRVSSFPSRPIFPRGRPFTASLPPNEASKPHHLLDQYPSLHRKWITRSQLTKENVDLKRGLVIPPYPTPALPQGRTNTPGVPKGKNTPPVQSKITRTPVVSPQTKKTPVTSQIDSLNTIITAPPVLPQDRTNTPAVTKGKNNPPVQSKATKTPVTSPQDSLSPIMSRKQKFTPAEYRQAAGRGGHKTPASPRRKPQTNAPQNPRKTQKKHPRNPPWGTTQTGDLKPQENHTSQLPSKSPSTQLAQGGKGRTGEAGERRGRSSRRSSAPRRSYSDPLYEYLKEDPSLAHPRRHPRRRRHSGGGGREGDGGMRNSHSQLTLLPDGCELTVGELRDMASRQQQQIETQQQLLVAREQRLKYLKQQDSRAAAVAAEADRLRRLKERVELQEAKLRRLRALRGQVEATRLNTASLTTDLDAMRHLFSEKEKELVVAVTKVEELTRQLEELRQGRSPLNTAGEQHHNELDKLRRELLYRNSVNREASARVAAQRETLAARREEISRIDKRVSELQQRLHRKRLLNQQLASQITAATQAKQAQLKAVQQKALREGIHSSSVDDAQTPSHLKIPSGEDLSVFGPNKSDPKYQTLPHNTKFSATQRSKDADSAPTTPTTPTPSPPDSALIPPTHPQYPSNPPNAAGNGGNGLMTRTVHSIPTHAPSRSLAHAPPGSAHHKPPPPPNPNMTPRVFGPGTQHFPQRTQPLGGAALTQTQEPRPLLPPTSLSLSFHQKLSPGVTSQSRALLLSQDVERGGEVVEEGERGGEGGGRSKPSLPPKPPVPSKPLPPPRQKGDQLGGSADPLTSPGPPPARPSTLQTRPQHVYRYASQNVIMSTYTQVASGSGSSSGGDTPQMTPDDDTTTTTATTTTSSTSSTRHSSTNNNNLENTEKIHVSKNRRIEMPPDFLFPEDETPPSDLLGRRVDEIEADGVDNAAPLMSLSELRIDGLKEEEEEEEDEVVDDREENRQPDGADTMTLLAGEEGQPENETDRPTTTTTTRRPTTTTTTTTNVTTITNLLNNNTNNNNNSGSGVVLRRLKKGNLKTKNSLKVPRRVSFDPLALLLDASLEGELELVKRTAMEVTNPSAANDEGITALHNAICAGHLEIVTFLVTFGCDVNAQDSDGWTPLHCAASCNNVAMVRFLVEHGACILATTLSDHETPAEKCEQDEEGYDGCSQYLYSVQEKLGIMNGGVVYGVYDYEGQAGDELTFLCGDAITILRRGDEYEREWWWAQHANLIQGYVPRNLLGLYPRVKNPLKDS